MPGAFINLAFNRFSLLTNRAHNDAFAANADFFPKVI